MRSILALLAITLLVTACQKTSAPEPKTDEDKAFYALGTMLGQRFKDLDLSKNELELVKSGLEAAALGQTSSDPGPHQMKIQEIFQERMKKKSEAVKKDGESYLEKFLKEEGVKKTESGLAYKIIKEGSKKKPKSTDEVEVHYHGTLIDGTVFDSSKERGKTVTFPLNRVIKGWTEGLQLIGEGGEIKLVIPSELAYGDSGAPPKIPGGATLTFDVQLFKVTEKKGDDSLLNKAKKAVKKKK